MEPYRPVLNSNGGAALMPNRDQFSLSSGSSFPKLIPDSVQSMLITARPASYLPGPGKVSNQQLSSPAAAILSPYLTAAASQAGAASSGDSSVLNSTPMPTQQPQATMNSVGASTLISPAISLDASPLNRYTPPRSATPSTSNVDNHSSNPATGASATLTADANMGCTYDPQKFQAPTSSLNNALLQANVDNSSQRHSYNPAHQLFFSAPPSPHTNNIRNPAKQSLASTLPSHSLATAGSASPSRPVVVPLKASRLFTVKSQSAVSSARGFHLPSPLVPALHTNHSSPSFVAKNEAPAGVAASRPLEVATVPTALPMPRTEDHNILNQVERQQPDDQQSESFLHDMVGGRVDMATCKDVLEQVGGNMDRAVEVILEVYGAGDEGHSPGGSGAISHVAPFGDPHGNGTEEQNRASSTSLPMQNDRTLPHNAAAYPELGADVVGPNMQGGTLGNYANDDPWSVSDPCEGDVLPTGGPVGSGGAGGTELPLEVAGIFAPEKPMESPHRRMESLYHQEWKPGDAIHQDYVAHDPSEDAAAGAIDDGWQPMSDSDEEEAQEDKLRELRIYFPNVEDSILRTTLAALKGSVQEALTVLSEQYEYEIYQEIQQARQAEADAELARRLAEQDSSPSGAADRSAFVSDSAAEDYVLNDVHGISEQVSALGLRAATPPSPTSDLRASRERWGIRLLVHLYGPTVDEDLLSAVLATHNGDVTAARAALRGVGLTEQQQKQTSESQGRRQHDQDLLAPAAPGMSFETDRRGATAWSADASTPTGAGFSSGGLASEIANHRCPPAAERTSVLLSGNSGISGNAPGNGRRSGTAYVQTCPAGCVELPSNDAALGPSRHVQAAGSATAASGLASGATGNVGPIRMLASFGVDFQEMGLSAETLRCIRVAFEESGLREVLQQRAANSVQNNIERQQMAGRRPGFGLTHEEKQALWAAHRELPLALQDMKTRLRTGARAAYATADSNGKNLARELTIAACALDPIIQAEHHKASHRIYDGINAAVTQQWKTDLHALLPIEVTAKLDEELQRLCNLRCNLEWCIITGKGLHSRNGGPKLPAIVDKWLEVHNLQGVSQQGGVLVRLTPELCDWLIAAFPGPGPPSAQAIGVGGAAGSSCGSVYSGLGTTGR